MQTALARAAAETPRERQSALFEEPAEPVPLPAERKAGRPSGSRNRRTEEYAQFLTQKHGDPLDIATRIAARNITLPGELERLAKELGMDRPGAAEFWLRTLTAILPYLHQRMPQAVILSPGAPGGERVEIIDGEGALDITPAAEYDRGEDDI